MDQFALMVQLQPIKGKEKEVETFLREAMPAVEKETGTSTWHALRGEDGSYFIFDTFPDEKSRESHLSGEIAKALGSKAAELFSASPAIKKLDIIAVKMPEVLQY